MIVAFGVLTFVFGFLHLSGDPVMMLLRPDATQEEIDGLRHKMGFDQPIPIQYYRFLKGVIKGNFGSSFVHNRPALELVLERLPATGQLTLAAMIIAFTFSIPLGVLAATKHGTIFDNVAIGVAALGQAIPYFWLGMMLILLFSVSWRMLPATGIGSILHIILPAMTLGFYSMASLARLVRSSLLDILRKDYIRTARSKGLPEVVVICKHALKNVFIPVITLLGLQTGMLLGGAVVTETVFAWPGIGRLVIVAIFNRDFPVVQASVFVMAMIFVIINFLVDVTYTMMDPRVRIG